MGVSLDHRCSGEECPHKGQTTIASCRCHKTREQVAQDIIAGLSDALDEAEKMVAACVWSDYWALDGEKVSPSELALRIGSLRNTTEAER